MSLRAVVLTEIARARRRELCGSAAILVFAAPFLLGGCAPTVSTAPDRQIVPGERIGEWALDMTIPRIDDVISGSPARSSGIADPRPGPDFRAGFVNVLWPGRFLGAGTNDTASGKVVCLITWSPAFQTQEGVHPGGGEQEVANIYGSPSARTIAGPETSRLIYNRIGIAFVLKKAAVQQIYIFRPGEANVIWRF